MDKLQIVAWAIMVKGDKFPVQIFPTKKEAEEDYFWKKQLK